MNENVNWSKIEDSKDARVIGNYALGKTVGKGGTAKVKLGVNKETGERVAIKVVKKAQLTLRGFELPKIRREIKILSRLRHPNIIRLCQVIETQEKIYIVLEYCDGGELFDHIVAKKFLREKEARNFFRQMISGIGYCHAHGIAHRDLKPENMLLAHSPNGVVLKIIDFGLANYESLEQLGADVTEAYDDEQDNSWGDRGGTMHTFCGSVSYAAPEVIRGEAPYHGKMADVWSLGVILYAMCCGSLPFSSSPEKGPTQITSDYRRPTHITPSCQDLIQGMLTKDPMKRLTLDQVRKHPWVNEGYTSPPSFFPPENPVSVVNPPSPSTTTVLVMDGPVVKQKSSKEEIVVPTIKGLTTIAEEPGTTREPNLQVVVPKRDLSPRIVTTGAASAPPSPVATSPVSNTTPPVPRRNTLLELPTPTYLPSTSAGSTTAAVAAANTLPPPKTRQRAKSMDTDQVKVINSYKHMLVERIEQEGAKSKTATTSSVPPATSPPTTPDYNKRAPFQSVKDNELTSSGERKRNFLSKLLKWGSTDDAGMRSHSGATAATSINVTPSKPSSPDKSNRPKTPGQQIESMKSVKGPFSSDNTSTKPVEEIMAEIERVLNENRWLYNKYPYAFKKCRAFDKAKLVFDVEVVKLFDLNVYGVVFKRIKGDVWTYKNICSSLLSSMKL